MRWFRIAVLFFSAWFLFVNGPLAIHGALTDEITPYGWKSPTFHYLTAAVNIGVGLLGAKWATHRLPLWRFDIAELLIVMLYVAVVVVLVNRLGS
jgi:hypothetical protein